MFVMMVSSVFVILREPLACFDVLFDVLSDDKDRVVCVFAERIFCLTNRSDVSVNRSPSTNGLVSSLRKEYAVLFRFALLIDCRLS